MTSLENLSPTEMPELLIVEDETAIRELVAFVCESEGFRVNRAEDIASARAALALSRPDLILFKK